MAEYAVMPKADYQDACDAVREKTGGTEAIKSGDMGAQIRSISGAEDLDAELTAQETSLDSQAALIAELQTVLQSKASAGAAEPVIQALEITENGTYTAPDGVDGYSPVTVNVAGSGTTEVWTFTMEDGSTVEKEVVVA